MSLFSLFYELPFRIGWKMVSCCKLRVGLECPFGYVFFESSPECEEIEADSTSLTRSFSFGLESLACYPPPMPDVILQFYLPPSHNYFTTDVSGTTE